MVKSLRKIKKMEAANDFTYQSNLSANFNLPFNINMNSRFCLNLADFEIIQICLDLITETYDTEIVTCKDWFKFIFEWFAESSFFNNLANSEDQINVFKLTANEFTQAGIRKCIRFCMNLPGNNDLSTGDRAKLLKYGAYEQAVRKFVQIY